MRKKEKGQLVSGRRSRAGRPSSRRRRRQKKMKSFKIISKSVKVMCEKKKSDIKRLMA